MSPRSTGRSAGAGPEEDAAHRVTCRLDELLHERGLTLTELSERVGISVVNLSILKNDRARSIRFSTLTAVCDALGCQPGDLLTLAPAPGRRVPSGRAASR